MCVATSYLAHTEYYAPIGYVTMTDCPMGLIFWACGMRLEVWGLGGIIVSDRLVVTDQAGSLVA